MLQTNFGMLGAKNAVRKMLEDNTALQVLDKAVAYVEGVAHCLIYHLFQVALPKERQGITLADIRSAINKYQDFKKVRKVVSAPFLLVWFLGLNKSTCQTSETSQTCFSSLSINVKNRF